MNDKKDKTIIRVDGKVNQVNISMDNSNIYANQNNNYTEFSKAISTNEKFENIFISYSRKDTDFVLKFVKALQENGIKTWVDQIEIKPGQSWDMEIQKVLEFSEKIIVVLSPDSVQSTNVLDEIAYSLDNNIVVIPIMYKSCKKPFRLSRIQYIDFRNDINTGMGKLIEYIGRVKSKDNGNKLKIEEKSILIKINKSYYEGMDRDEIYKATRGNWKLSIEKAGKAKYVFSVFNGIIIEVFKISNWYRVKETDRIAFEGVVANDIRDNYIEKSVKHMYSKGEANPCKYINF
jgi:hypothetical protein